MKKPSAASRTRKPKTVAKSQPAISEKSVRSLTDAKVFGRGESYFNSGMIINPVRMDDQLLARCMGSGYEPYRVRVRFNKKGIVDTSCTCPYEWGGLCKHLVALLLTHIRLPESIKVRKPVAELVADWKKEELIAVLNDMLDHFPELYGLLDGTGMPEEDEYDGDGYYDENW